MGVCACAISINFSKKWNNNYLMVLYVCLSSAKAALLNKRTVGTYTLAIREGLKPFLFAHTKFEYDQKLGFCPVRHEKA